MYNPTYSYGKIWNTGLYVRLSAEDERKKRSGSVETQKDLLLNYIQDKPDLFLYSIYIDVDRTGTNFERPEFQRLMADIRGNKVNCIVVKDLSRFGRNFLDGSEYVEKIFPEMGVRFISINDNYDSADREIDQSMGVALKNLMNDMVIKDLSQRIKSSLPIVMSEGYYRGAFPPYGYISVKDEKAKQHFFVDGETAPIVKQIFQWRIEGTSYAEITKRLNDSKTVTPQRRLQQNGFYDAGKHCSDLWLCKTVRGILINPVYMGHMVQHRYETTEISTRKTKLVSPDEWICVPNTHEAIVTQEEFEKVQQKMWKKAETNEKGERASNSVVKTQNLLKGLVRCKKCGGSMFRKADLSKNKSRYYYRFICSVYQSRQACVYRKVNEEVILKAVMDALASHVTLIQLIEKKLCTTKKSTEEYAQLQKAEITKLKREISTLKTSKFSLYEKFLEGIVNEQDYVAQKKCIDKNIENSEREISQLLKKPETKIDINEADREWIEFVKSIKRKRKLTYEQIHTLVKEILVDDEQHIEIKLAYSFPLIEEFLRGDL